MRFIIILLISILLFGCTSQQTNSPQQNNNLSINTTISANVSANQSNSAPDSTSSEVVSSGNLTMPNPSSEGSNQTDSISMGNDNIISVGESKPIQPENGTSNKTSKPKSGLVFGDGPYLLFLDDISTNSDTNSACGIFSISYAENQSEITRLLICPGVSDYWRSPDGHTYRIFVEKVVPGYTKESNWAQISIFG
ncbi:hypothetical protein HY988_01350 [Candidatus Micrarchaeota archaeon]|nr:hypothetical protein [Candidatus Micrarchaeota archaeon]